MITFCNCVPGFTGQDCSMLLESCDRGKFIFNGKCEGECPDGFYGDGASKPGSVKNVN